MRAKATECERTVRRIVMKNKGPTWFLRFSKSSMCKLALPQVSQSLTQPQDSWRVRAHTRTPAIHTLRQATP